MAKKAKLKQGTFDQVMTLQAPLRVTNRKRYDEMSIAELERSLELMEARHRYVVFLVGEKRTRREGK